MQVSTVLVSHDPQQKNTSRGPSTLHIFKDQQGNEYTTWKTEIANVAFGLLNQPVVVDFTEKQNGQYTNRVLDGVVGANGAAPTAMAPAQAPKAPAAPAQLYNQDEKQILIMYQSFANNAALAMWQELPPEERALAVLDALTKQLIIKAGKFAKQSVAAATAGGASSPGAGGEAGASSEAPAKTDEDIPF